VRAAFLAGKQKSDVRRVAHESGGAPANALASSAKLRRSGRGEREAWAALMRVTFARDMPLCPRNGGRLRHIAQFSDAAVARNILAYLGLPVWRAPEASASMPPLFWPEVEDAVVAFSSLGSSPEWARPRRRPHYVGRVSPGRGDRACELWASSESSPRNSLFSTFGFAPGRSLCGFQSKAAIIE
jgi:hypothetical protein